MKERLGWQGACGVFGQEMRMFQAERIADAKARRCEVGTRFREV